MVLFNRYRMCSTVNTVRSISLYKEVTFDVRTAEWIGTMDRGQSIDDGQHSDVDSFEFCKPI